MSIKNEKPSFGILLIDKCDRHAIGEISLKMLNEGLEDIGYQITKIE